MIPLTVSFFLKQSTIKGKGLGRALLYSFFILVIYILSSLPFHFLDAIDSQDEKNSVINSLITTNKEIIQISELQANKFAGNMLQVQGDKKYLIMSESAFNSLSKEQIQKIESYCSILYSDLKTIEKFGGGSARCMMAEIFLPLKK